MKSLLKRASKDLIFRKSLISKLSSHPVKFPFQGSVSVRGVELRKIDEGEFQVVYALMTIVSPLFSDTVVVKVLPTDKMFVTSGGTNSEIVIVSNHSNPVFLPIL